MCTCRYSWCPGQGLQLREGSLRACFPGGLPGILGSLQGLKLGQLRAGQGAKSAHQVVTLARPLHPQGQGFKAGLQSDIVAPSEVKVSQQCRALQSSAV